MARLPTPGGDNGNWGTVLNDYLSQIHKADGTLKDNSITNAAIAPDAVTAAEIQDGSIQEAQLSSGVQTKLNQVAPTWSTLIGKPAVIAAGADQATARNAIGALDSSTLASEIANSESAANNAVIDVTTSVIAAGAPGLVKTVDARGGSSTSRPAWAGQVVWLINDGDPNPVHIIDGDMIWEVATTPVAWSPSQLPNKVVWFDAQTLNLADGAVVASWPDLSENGNDLTQATAGAQPLFDIDKFNGHPAVVADGSNDYLETTLTPSVTGPLTYYFVAGAEAADNSGTDTLVGGTYSVSRTSDERYRLSRGLTLESAASTWAAGAQLIKVVFNGASSSVEINNVSILSGDTGSSSTLTSLTMFANASHTTFFTGGIGSLILVQGLVSTENDALLKEYLNDRWDLGLSL